MEINKNQIIELKEYFYPNGEFTNRAVSSPYVRKNYPQIYELVKDNYRPKLYMLLHDMENWPICANPSCNNEVGFKDMKYGFRKTCSKKCLGEFQKQDTKFRDKISNTHKNLRTIEYKEKYPDLDIRSANTKNNYTVYNYCEHSPFEINSNLLHRLRNNNECICNQCKKSLYENYIPTQIDIIEFLNKFDNFYANNNRAIKKSWFLKHYPKELKIIETYTSNVIDASLTERIHLFKSRLTDRPICPNCNLNKLKFLGSQLAYTKFCESTNCQKNISMQEIELRNFFDENNITYETHFNIGKNNYDFKINNLLIEMNGLHWHGDKEQHDKLYHYNKLKLAQSKENDLLTIWEDDWADKRDLIKSIIKERLNILSLNINSSSCNIQLVSKEDEITFLSNNHIDNYIESHLAIGLFYNNELVSILTFKKLGINTYEILRFCNTQNTSVGDSLHTLWNHFIKNYTPSEVIYWQNLDNQYKHNGNDIFLNIGFIESEEHKLNYWYAKSRKKWIEEKALSEEEIKFRKLYMIYGNGNNKYLYKYN